MAELEGPWTGYSGVCPLESELLYWNGAEDVVLAADEVEPVVAAADEDPPTNWCPWVEPGW